MKRALSAGCLALALLAGLPAGAQEVVDHRALYRQAAPGVVLIAALTDRNFGNTGTGSIVSADGLVLTNHHVIWDDKNGRAAPTIYIFLKPPKVTGKNSNDLQFKHEAEVVHHSAPLDLALLRIKNRPAGLTVLPLMDSEQVEVGAPTVAIGHPEQGSKWTLTTGAVSATIYDFNATPGKHVFQMETSVNRGNSGGPLLDHKGNLIGVNSMIARVGAGGVAITGVNFAVMSNVARKWLAEQGQRLTAIPVPYETAVAAAAAPAPGPDGAVAEPAPAVPAPMRDAAPAEARVEGSVSNGTPPATGTTAAASPVGRREKRPKAVSKIPPGRQFSESQLEKMKRELEDMADEMERDFRDHQRPDGF